MTDHALHVLAIALLLEITIQVWPPAVRWYELATLTALRVSQVGFMVWFVKLVVSAPF